MNVTDWWQLLVAL